MAHKSHGVKLQYVDEMREVVGSLVSVDGIPMTGDALDVTNHDNAEGFRQFIQGLRDGGTFDVEGQYDAGTMGLRATRLHFVQNAMGGVRQMAIIYPTGVEITFGAILIALNVPGEANVDGVLPFNATFQVTGRPVTQPAKKRLAFKSTPVVASIPGTGGMGLGWFNPQVTVQFVEPPDSISGIASTADSGQGPSMPMTEGVNTWSYGFPIYGQSKYAVKLTATRAGYEDFECTLPGTIDVINLSGAVSNIDTTAVMTILTYLPDGPLGTLSPSANSYAFNIHEDAGPVTIRFDFIGFPADGEPPLLGSIEHVFSGDKNEIFNLNYEDMIPA